MDPQNFNDLFLTQPSNHFPYLSTMKQTLYCSASVVANNENPSRKLTVRLELRPFGIQIQDDIHSCLFAKTYGFISRYDSLYMNRDLVMKVYIPIKTENESLFTTSSKNVMPIEYRGVDPTPIITRAMTNTHKKSASLEGALSRAPPHSVSLERLRHRLLLIRPPGWYWPVA